jgi:hypothetical protein
LQTPLNKSQSDNLNEKINSYKLSKEGAELYKIGNNPEFSALLNNVLY